MSEELEELMNSNPEWYKNLLLTDVKSFIKANIESTSRSFIAIGYYLKYVRDNELFKEDGYSGILEFAQSEFGISKSWASKWMSINDQFSVSGNSPILLDQYKEFSSSKLSEMLYLSDEQREQVTVSTTNVEIREIKKPVKVEKEVSVPKMEDEQFYGFKSKLCKFGGGKCNLLTDPSTCSGKTKCKSNYIEVENEVVATSHKEEVSDRAAAILDFLMNEKECALIDLRRFLDRDIAKQGKEEACTHFLKFHCGQGQEIPANKSHPGFEFMFNYEQLGKASNIDLRWGAEKAQISPSDFMKLYLKYSLSHEVDNQPVTVNNEPEIVHNEPELVNEVDEPERECSNCNYNDMDPDEYRLGHLVNATEFPCNNCDDKLNHWEPKVDGLVLDCFNQEEGWYKEIISDEPEEVETTQAEIIQTVPEELPKPIWSAKQHLKDAIEREEGQIKEMREHWKAKNPDALLKHETILLALKLHLTDMEYPDPILVNPEQPEIPILKNNDTRKDFIDAYTTWPVWIDTELTGERYYRYDLSEKVAMVVKVSRKHSYVGYKETKDYEYGAEQYHLLGVKSDWSQNKTIFKEDESRTFAECNTNKSSLVDYLKEFQKK